MSKILHSTLLKWYSKNARELPWRSHRDPYKIWISEVMLQQTTVTAVIPYYHRFIQAFPNITSLANAAENEVLKNWAGLGYYSRARNLHKASQHLATQGFAKSWVELIELPGFGPYTSRAVSSIAFGEPVGVLDGNVIRVLSRLKGQPFKWWESKGRESLQTIADSIAGLGDSHLINQGLMELGSTICTPQNPSCLICPWFKFCEARLQQKQSKLPLSKPKRKIELWSLTAKVDSKNGKIYLEKNLSAPFLKNLPLPPLLAKKLDAKPKNFDFIHSITHHKIYVKLDPRLKARSQSGGSWVKIDSIETINPSSLMKKLIKAAEKKDLVK